MIAHIRASLKTDNIDSTNLGPDLTAWRALDGPCSHLILTSCAKDDTTQPIALTSVGLLTLKDLYEHFRTRCRVCES